jgi:hypothetical protein
VPGLPRRRIGRSFAVFAAAATAMGIWVWRSAGDVTPAVASTTETTEARIETPTLSMIAPVQAQAAAPAKTAPTTARAAKHAMPAKAIAPKANAAPKPAPKPTAAPLPLPAPAAADPAPAPADDSIDPEQVTTSIRDLLGNEPKLDVDP